MGLHPENLQNLKSRPWRQGLIQAIDQAVVRLNQQGTLQITTDIQNAKAANALRSHTNAIPSPIDFYNALREGTKPLAKAHVDGYIDNAVNHSNRRKRIRDSVVNSLLAAKRYTQYLPPNGPLDFGIFNKDIPGAGGGSKTLVDIAQFWSNGREGTERRIREFKGAYDGGTEMSEKYNLRRYGISAEAADIRTNKGFYQMEGVSFEQYK